MELLTKAIRELPKVAQVELTFAHIPSEDELRRHEGISAMLRAQNPNLQLSAPGVTNQIRILRAGDNFLFSHSPPLSALDPVGLEQVMRGSHVGYFSDHFWSLLVATGQFNISDEKPAFAAGTFYQQALPYLDWAQEAFNLGLPGPVSLDSGQVQDFHYLAVVQGGEVPITARVEASTGESLRIAYSGHLSQGGEISGVAEYEFNNPKLLPFPDSVTVTHQLSYENGVRDRGTSKLLYRRFSTETPLPAELNPELLFNDSIHISVLASNRTAYIKRQGKWTTAIEPEPPPEPAHPDWWFLGALIALSAGLLLLLLKLRPASNGRD